MKIGNSLVTQERQDVLLKYADLASSLNGNIAELGVAYGGITIALAKKYPKKLVYAFDTFDGFTSIPENYFNASPKFNSDKYTENGREWKRDWGSEIPYNDVLLEFKNYKNINVKKGLFPHTTTGLENEKYCFVHLDVDIYSSTLFGLEYFYERLIAGGYILLDDFWFENEHPRARFPQIREAVEEYFKTPAKNIVKSEVPGQGIIIK